MSRDSTSRPEARVIVEHIRNGAWLKVTAVDTVTGLEASAAGPAREPGAVERLAVTRLQRLIEAQPS
jgi:hypothetical protein